MIKVNDKRRVLAAVFGLLMVVAVSAAAQDVLRPDLRRLERQAQQRESEFQKQDGELQKSGTLSGTSTAGGAGVAVPGPWGGPDVDDKSAAPIAGSVSRVSGNEWIARIVNNSEDRYQASIAVAQLDERGRVIRTDSFSVSLPAKGSVDRRVRAHPSALNSELQLKSWKRFEKPKTREQIEQQVAEKKKELATLEQQLGETEAPADR